MHRILAGILLMALVLFSLTGCLPVVQPTTIKGQVVLNGVGTNEVTLSIWANNKLYFGDSVSVDGRFSHGSDGFDKEFCVPGCVVSFYFNATAPGAMACTEIIDYQVKKGVNDLGTIEIGTQGMNMVSPVGNATVSTWPATFTWTAYNRSVSSLAYRIIFGAGTWNVWNIEWSSQTTCDVNWRTGFDSVTAWKVGVQYSLNGLNYAHESKQQLVTLSNN